MLLFLFADADPISGGAGWVGAGLLGLVLGWLLLKHLPDKDRQLAVKDRESREQLERKDGQVERMLDRKNEQLQTLLEAHAAQVERMHAENRAALEQVIRHCREEMTISSQLLQRDLVALGESIGALNRSLQPRRRQAPPQKPGESA